MIYVWWVLGMVLAIFSHVIIRPWVHRFFQRLGRGGDKT